MANGDRLDTNRAGRGVGVELPDRAGEELEDAVDRDACSECSRGVRGRRGRGDGNRASWRRSGPRRGTLVLRLCRGSGSARAHGCSLYRPTIPRTTLGRGLTPGLTRGQTPGQNTRVSKG